PNHPDTFLSSVQIGITLVGILTGIFSGEKFTGDLELWLETIPTLAPYKGILATSIVVVAITYFTLVLGELLPKRIGLSNPETIAKRVAGPMRIISLITFPFIWLLSKSTWVLVKLLGIKSNENQVTEEEIKAIISEGTEQGTIEEAEQEIIERVFHLGDRTITSLMTHRSDIEWVSLQQTVGEMKAAMSEMIHTVYPVCDGSIDNIKGVISVKDILKADEQLLVKDIMKPAMYVPENNSAYVVLERFKQTKIHHCFIVNEYGSIEGMITLNDILEAIVGDIPQQDEVNYEIVQRADGSYLVDAQISFFDFLAYFDHEDWMPEGEQEFDTLAGFVLHKLEKIPATGDLFSWRGYQFEIIDMDNHRIDKILVTIEKAPD
ncbi:MAG TPA: hemolysin, partial [Chitinophagaceae bacterium]|nr:hemolysin [Chitinophagaceae bacterium]